MSTYVKQVRDVMEAGTENGHHYCKWKRIWAAVSVHHCQSFEFGYEMPMEDLLWAHQTLDSGQRVQGQGTACCLVKWGYCKV